MRRVAANSVVLTVASYFSSAGSLLTYLVAARALGPETFGSLSAAIGIVMVFAGLGDFGVNGWAIRELARDPQSSETFRRTLAAKIAVAAALACAWFMVVMLAPVMGGPLRWDIALLAGYLFTLIVSATLTVPFRASENMAVVGVVTAAEKAVALAVSLVMLAVIGYRADVLPIALLLGGLTSVACAAMFVPRRFLTLARPTFYTIVDLWRSSYSFGLVGASGQILRADTAIVSLAAGAYSAGVYAAPARLTTFLSVIPMSFSVAVFPRMVRSSGLSLPRRSELVGSIVMVAVMAGVLSLCAAVAPTAVHLLLGNAYSSSVPILRIFLLMTLVNAANYPLLAFLQAEGNEVFAGWSMSLVSLIGMLAIAVGAGLDGATGGAIGAVVLQVLALLILSWKVWSISRGTIPVGAEVGA